MESPLIKLANLRANLSVKGIGNLFTKYYPERVFNQNIFSYLLNFTRHTPRDFLQLMIYMQKHYCGGRLTFNQIREAISEYSIEYFLTELHDELFGLVEREVVDMIFQLFASLRRDIFTINDLEKQKRFIAHSGRLQLGEILKSLYECNAVGNVYEDKNGNRRYAYKYIESKLFFCL